MRALTLALVLVSGAAAAQTVVVPQTTITVDERPMVVQPAPFGPPALVPTPSPQDRRRRATDQTQQTPAATATPTQPRAQGPRRPTNGYSSFLTGPIDLTRPPAPQQ